jgi:hypothetical protein
MDAASPVGVVDADRYTASLQPPRVRIDGQVYSGRVLSIQEWQPYGTRARTLETAMDEALKAKGEGETATTIQQVDTVVQHYRDELAMLARQYFRAVFPAAPWWAFWRKDPVPKLMLHPARDAILKDFFAHQVGLIKKLRAHLTDGSDSPS